MDKNKEIGYYLENFEIACDELAKLISKHLFHQARDWYWVDDIVGGICDFDGTDSLTPEEMVLILNNDVDYEEYAEWRDANIKHGGTKGFIKLSSWIKGHRHSMLADKPKHSNLENNVKE